MIDIRFPEMFKNLKQFETLIGLMDIGHTAVGNVQLWNKMQKDFFQERW